MKTFLNGLRAFCDSLLSVFGIQPEPDVTENTETKKRKPDTTVLNESQKRYIFGHMRIREKNNSRLTRNSPDYITMDEITEDLNHALYLQKSRQYYSALYKEMKGQVVLGVDPFRPKQGK